MEGWRRRMDWEATGLTWILPSPKMPTPDTALLYPGMVLLEGTSLSEGRGTTRPFEICGAPFLDSREMAFRLGAAGLPGLRPRPLSFQPTFDKFSGALCGGVQLHVTAREAFKSVLTAVAVLAEARRQSGERDGGFRWTAPPYEYESTRLPIDILAGSEALRTQIDAGASLAEIEASWAPGLEAFAKMRRDILLYE